MSGLLKYSTPAERLRGLSFSEIGGTFTGSENIIYNLSGNEFNSNNISILCEFWPSFNWDDNTAHFFMDSSVSRVYFYKLSNNTLRCAIGSIVVFNLASGVYSPYWRVNERNVIAATYSSTVNNLYLNNNLINSNSTSWPIGNLDTVYVGTNFGGAAGFVGDISKVRVYKEILTQQEISDIWHNSTYNYKNKYRIHYPMTQATHTGSQTLDVSGNNLHGTLVGTPTKLTGQGYNLNGIDQYITFPEQTFPGEFTLAIFSNPEMETLDGFFGHTTDTNKMILFISGKVFVRVTATSDSTVDSNGAVVNFLGLTRDADNKVDLYVNQKRYRLFGDVAQVGDSVWDYIGKTESAAQNFTGDIFETIIDNKCLTPTQMHDLSLRRFALDI
jgi:hypothetical protein